MLRAAQISSLTLQSFVVYCILLSDFESHFRPARARLPRGAALQLMLLPSSKGGGRCARDHLTYFHHGLTPCITQSELTGLSSQGNGHFLVRYCFQGWPRLHHLLESPVQAFTASAGAVLFSVGATVAGQLACSPPTKVIWVQSPAGSLRIFAFGNDAGRCRWSVGFLVDLLFPPPFHSGAAPYSPQSPSLALKTSLRAAKFSPFFSILYMSAKICVCSTVHSTPCPVAAWPVS
ncbi:hypothetical protein PR048_007773 [Dryococelus australis]|uniref:Uncharacterized protein n=1 Tax=Dryococelus australis TaxID=614101 RepID=A0ABQ9HV67_9NEOP|nr:hypothetical protein PR048_007773 [Dryococelus australis]